MFWVIVSAFLLIECLISIWQASKKGYDMMEEVIIPFVILFVFFGVPTIISIGTGIYVYPHLVALHEEVLALKSEIETVRNAYYTTRSSQGLLGGSLDNFKQSTNLSEYIKEYARKKAKYNSTLAFYRKVKQSSFYKWFAQGCFVSDKIYELEFLR